MPYHPAVVLFAASAWSMARHLGLIGFKLRLGDVAREGLPDFSQPLLRGQTHFALVHLLQRFGRHAVSDPPVGIRSGIGMGLFNTAPGPLATEPGPFQGAFPAFAAWETATRSPWK